MTQGPNILQLIAQYAQLEQQLKPVLPQVSQKLVSDLLSTGMPAKALARTIGRSPSYVQGVANGDKCLTAALIVKVLRHAAASAKQAQLVPQNVQEAHNGVSQK